MNQNEKANDKSIFFWLYGIRFCTSTLICDGNVHNTKSTDEVIEKCTDCGTSFIFLTFSLDVRGKIISTCYYVFLLLLSLSGPIMSTPVCVKHFAGTGKKMKYMRTFFKFV